MSKTITICDGIYAVGGPNLSRSEDAYVYLVDAKSCLVLIDAGVGYGNDTQALRTLMAGLRRKIEIDPAKPRYILTEVGVGYRFMDE